MLCALSNLRYLFNKWRLFVPCPQYPLNKVYRFPAVFAGTQGRLDNAAHAGDEHSVAVGLDPYRKGGVTVDVYLGVDPRLLGIAHQHRTVFKPDRRGGAVLNLYIGMVEIVPEPPNLRVRPHKPMHQIDLMGGLD